MDEKAIFEKYFNGAKNFITPHVHGYRSVECDGEVVVFELSDGIGLFGDVIFGCSALLFKPQSNEICRIELSESFSKSEDALNYINNLSDDEIRAAGRYGEVKKL